MLQAHCLVIQKCTIFSENQDRQYFVCTVVLLLVYLKNYKGTQTLIENNLTLSTTTMHHTNVMATNDPLIDLQ